jgi:hypothetical protein
MAHPRKDWSHPSIGKLREICLAMPEATEKEAWGECTFRVGGKMFAMTDNDHHESNHVAVWVKAPPMVQEILVGSDPKRFFKPPYVGHKGWVGVRLDVEVKWDELAAILEDGYRMSAPKRLAVAMPSRLNASAKPRSLGKKTIVAAPKAIKKKTSKKIASAHANR